MSKKVAYGGILLALNIIVLLLANVIPINTIFLMGLASLPISIIIMEFGLIMGISFYIGSTVLSFFVMTSKLQWIVYTFTFGIYGVIKYFIEKDRPICIEIILKLLFTNVVVGTLCLMLRSIVYIPINIITIVAFQVIFLIYDYMYSSFIEYYSTKIKKIIKNI